MYIPELIAILVFAVIIFLAVGAAVLIRSRDERQHIIAKIRQDNTTKPVSEAHSPEQSGLKAYIIRLARALGDKIKPKNEDDIMQFRAQFLRAGFKSGTPLVLFFGIKALLALSLLFCFFLTKLLANLHPGFPHIMAISVVTAAIGFYIPNFWLGMKIAQRREKIIAGFPDALDLLIVCTEAGMGLDAALRRVGTEMAFSNAVVSDELKTLNLELRAGKSKADALRNLALRTGVEDINNLTTLLIQTDKFGTSVAQALRIHADAMRSARAQRIEEMAAKLPVKLLFPTIFCIFPSLFLIIIGPALIQAFRNWGR